MKRKNENLMTHENQLEILSKRRNIGKPHEPHQGINSKRSYDLVIGSLNSRSLADYTTRQTKKFKSDLSTLELHDLTIPGRRDDGFCTLRGWFEAHRLILQLL